MTLHIQKALALAVIAVAASLHGTPTTAANALLFPLPPWRGPRQILAIGPWGGTFDAPPPDAALYVTADGTTHLLRPSDLPPRPSPDHRRIVATSDSHGKHRSIPVPPCDVFCHCGDILQRYGYLGDLGGGLPTLLDFSSWLRNDVPAEHGCVVVGGNHDKLLEKLGDDRVRTILSGGGGRRRRGRGGTYGGAGTSTGSRTTTTYLRDGRATVADLVFYGSPWSPAGNTGNRAFQRGTDATVEAARALRRDVSADAGRRSLSPNNHCAPDGSGGGGGGRKIDVLLTHAADGAWEDVVREARPVFWAHGHWHDGQGRVTLLGGGGGGDGDGTKGRLDGTGRCVSINVASNDMIYRPRNPPIVFDVPPGGD